jgi:surface-anchored protein
MCCMTKPIFSVSLVVALIVLGATATSARADAIPVYASGHCDLCADYEDDAMSLHYHFHPESPGKDEHGNSLVGEYEPSALYTRVSDSRKSLAPTSPAYKFLGATAGSYIWTLSQNNISGTPYLGFGTEELDDEVFPNGVTYTVISANGPGQFSMWMNDEFGSPIEYWATSNGIVDSQGHYTENYTQAAIAHSHANWGFTAEGVYEIRMRVSGTTNEGTAVSSPVETFTFLVGSHTVVPEPSTFALLTSAVGFAGVVVCRRRRAWRA